VNKRVVAHFL